MHIGERFWKFLTMIVTLKSCIRDITISVSFQYCFRCVVELCLKGVDKTRTIQLRYYNNLYYCNEEISLYMYIWRIYIFSHSYTVYTGMFALVLFLPRSPSLSTGKIKTGWMSMSQIISLKWENEIISTRIQNWAKVFASVQGRKLLDAKITPVYSNCKDAFI